MADETNNVYSGAAPAASLHVGVKLDSDKPRYDLIDPYATDMLAQVLTFGAKKYAPHNWRKGIAMSRLVAAAQRHLFAIANGEELDPETGLPHSAHLQCCAMFITWTQKFMPEMDDLWRGGKKYVARLGEREHTNVVRAATDSVKDMETRASRIAHDNPWPTDTELRRNQESKKNI